MIRLRQIKVDLNKSSIEDIKNKCAKKLKVKTSSINDIKIIEESIDARRKPQINLVYTVDISIDNEMNILSKIKDNDVFIAHAEEYKLEKTGTIKLKNRPIIVGTGPAGLFCGYLLAEAGYKPLLIERGECVEDRVKTVEEFWNTGKLNKESNVQFGEGGAGTFSDGKLVSQVKDNKYRKKKVFDTFIKCGADECISYMNKPHIGTDKLRNIVINMRNEIKKMGGEILYNTCLTDIKVVDNQITSININNDKWLDTDILVLALGHSARDTFKMLYARNLEMMSKPFAVGIRIQHPQKLINKSQYGSEEVPKLGAASYKLTYKAKNGRGVYSFCMCPGGYVVNASSEDNMLAVNGMSNSKRDSKNANSALIVTVNPTDFGESPLDGIKFQQELETRAFNAGRGMIPTQTYKDYKNNTISKNIGSIEPIFKGHYKLSNIRDIFPPYINESLIEAIDYFNSKIEGYSSDDAILSAVESRTSSPVKIIRDENGVSSILGIYPCGEGAGYAGGITSAAIDGIKVAEFIVSKYC